MNKQIDDYIAGYAEFIEKSPTAWHAAATTAEILKGQGFTHLLESESWPQLEAGAKGFIIRDGAVIGWHAGAGVTASSPFVVVGTHSDSPGFVLKDNTDRDEKGFSQVTVEVYGGPIAPSWIDRDLAIAGRVVLRDGSEKLIETAPFVRIPSLAVHLDRDQFNKLELDLQLHTQPVLGFEGIRIADVLRNAGVNPEDVAGSELRLVETQKPQRMGMNGELFSAQRQDNLSSAYAALQAFIEASVPAGQISVFAMFDHEEIGSGTRAGAAGPILRDVTNRLLSSIGATADDLARSQADTWVLSADAGHAIHPNYPQKHDPDVYPVMGHGPILKRNANHRYATDANGEAMWRKACENAGVEWQVLISNNTVTCGSTIGPITNVRTGFNTLDVGAPMLSMHSVRELTSCVDLYGLYGASKAFFELKI